LSGLSPWGASAEEVVEEMKKIKEAVLKELKIPTMDKKLIIEASTPGHYPRSLWEHFGIKDMPPWSLKEQAEAIIGCVKAGAAAVHTHPRNPDTSYCYEFPMGQVQRADLLAKILDIAYEEVDFVPLGHAWLPKNWDPLGEADFITHTKELLELGKGNKYIQGNVVPTWIYPWTRKGLLSTFFSAQALREGIAFLEENCVKPLIAMHIDHLLWFKISVYDYGVFKTKPHINIQEGKHGVNRSFLDPYSYINLINSIELVRRVFPEATIGLHCGGRNWLPMTVLAIMLGVDLVRVGIEDMFWIYPHKDEFIKRPSEAVERVVQIAKLLGREIATPADARRILGIKVTYEK